MPNVLRFKHINIERQTGELARVRIIQGVDYGSLFVITGSHASIGRGEDNDIVISDLKSSRNHAELIQTAAGWKIEDKNSANGILYNGQPTREAILKFNDTVVIGETTLEFIPSTVGTQMLIAPLRTAEQIQSTFQQAASAFSQFNGGQSSIDSSQNSSNKSLLRIILIGGVLAFIYFGFGNDSKPKLKSLSSGSSKEGKEKVDLAAYLPVPESNKSAETLFKDGFREYLSGNFTRARTQFETVLQIVPGHPLATLYLENCNKSVESAVKTHLEVGKKSLEAGKLRDARANYSRVLRLLYRDQSNPAYIEAKDQLEKVQKKMTGEQNT